VVMDPYPQRLGAAGGLVPPATPTRTLSAGWVYTSLSKTRPAPHHRVILLRTAQSHSID